MTTWAWLVPALPAVAAALGWFVPRRTDVPAAATAIVGSLASLVVAIAVLASAEANPATVHESSTAWTPTGGIALHIGTRIDGLAAVVAVMVAVVSLLVQVYSVVYMSGDRRYAVYAAEVSLFSAAMLLVVVSSDLFELLVGWEVMGLCSYLLIGHYWQTEGARAAAVKAFVTTRLGDTGFLFGIFALGVAARSFDISDVLAKVPAPMVRRYADYLSPTLLSSSNLSHTTLVVGALLLIAGVVGKSAQFPLHVWLPDAMAGPTPISALIHAATMVAAGIYVVARLYPIFLAAHAALVVLGIIACITMLGAALAALAEDDLKRVLAWSTVSQLAYMAAGLAVGGWTASVYHLLTHAAFKALLFLAAGSVLRSVGSNYMSDMGGLWRRMPVTAVTAVVGAAALAGLPPFAGAFSKDGILAAARERGQLLGMAVYFVGLLTVVVTAAYVTRFVVRTFFGTYRGRLDPHESPWPMTGPLVLLAVAAVGLGAPVLPASYGVRRWLFEPSGSLPLHVGVSGVALTSGLALLGVLLVAVPFARAPETDPVERLGRLATPLRRAFWVDEFYAAAVVRPVRALATAVGGIDRRGVDGTVTGIGRATSGLGGVLRLVQGGNVQGYLSGLVLSVVVVAVAVAAVAA